MTIILQALHAVLSVLLAAAMSLSVCLFGGGGQTQTDTATYAGKAQAVYQGIHSECYSVLTNHYLETASAGKKFYELRPSYLWSFSSVFDGVVALNANSGGEEAKQLSKLLHCLDGYYNPDRSPQYGLDSYPVLLGGGDRYYDDNMWIGLAFCNLYAQTGESEYLKKATEIYDFCMTGYDTALGGGIYWREGDKASKHTCSNGPQILLALQLYLLGGKAQQEYLDAALDLYTWVNANLRAPEDVYWDNIRVGNGSVDKTTWTYNTGTMLYSNVLLYQATGDAQYLQDAQRIAQASLAYFAPQGDMPDSKWFNAVLLRGYAALYAVDGDDSAILVMQRYADSVWEQRDAQTNLFASGGEFPLLHQGAMLEIYSILAAVLD